MSRPIAVLTAVVLLVAGAACAQDRADAAAEKAAIEQSIRASIAWALTKDRPLLERVIAHDPELFIFNPDSTSVVGWEAFVKGFDFWMDPRFKATVFDLRDLRIRRSRGGDVAWFSGIVDDLAEWDGKPVGWKDTRWTGVLEKRDGRWAIVQMHFSFASDRMKAETAAKKEAALHGRLRGTANAGAGTPTPLAAGTIVCPVPPWDARSKVDSRCDAGVPARRW